MNIDIFGTSMLLIASKSFPAGLTLTSFADDIDTLDAPVIQILEYGMGTNGDLNTWSKAIPVEVTIGIIPGTDDDRSLQVLFNLNRVGKAKVNVVDKITLIVTQPDGRKINYINGRTLRYLPSDSAASTGRLKSKPYSFVFENYLGV